MERLLEVEQALFDSRRVPRGLRGSFFIFSLLIALTAGSSIAAPALKMLGPGGIVSPDGFEIAVIPSEGAVVSASGARVEARTHPTLGRTFTVTPDRASREVTVTAAKDGVTAQARWTVGPPAARVELALEPAQPVKGRDTEAQLTIRLLRTDGSIDRESPPPAVQANVGTLEAPVQVEPGVYRARYVLPDTGHPEVAVIVAFAPWPHPSSVHGAFGALRVPLATAFELPGVAEKHSTMTMEIAGEKFGPVPVGADGSFKVAVVVPPGYRFAKGTAVDRAGNRRTNKLDLQLPPTDQLACVMNPRVLPADGASRARILCAVSDPYGKPISNAKVQLSAKRGTVTGPKAVSDLLEWIYVAPSPPSLQTVVLSAQWKAAGPLSTEKLAMTLQQGPASHVELSAAEPLVHRGGALGLGVSAKDSFGRPREKAVALVVSSVGSVGPPAEVAAGEHVAVLEVPEGVETQSADLTARVFGPAAGKPAQLRAWREGAELILGVVDLAGAPVPKQELEVGAQVLLTADDGTVRTSMPKPGPALHVRHKRWPGLSLGLFVLPDGGLFPETPIIGSTTKVLVVRIGPPLPVNVRMNVRGREVTYWVEDPKGVVLAGRKVEVWLSAGSRGADEELEGGKRRFVVTAATPVDVSIADAQTGVMAVTQVRP